MCGIAVSIDLRGSGRAVPWALEQLRHRGPDGSGVLCAPDGNAAFEHTRLAIIDPDNREADQPFADPSGRWTIVYNGEVFNYREIRTRFERDGVVFRTDSDTEVILLGFLLEGEKILERLRGMFAFVIWDRETGEAFAARDQIGVKPFYYLVHDGLFAACSEVRPLLAYPGFRPTLDAAGTVEFLAFGNSFGERTVVEGVRKLAPGHCMRIAAGRVTVREYWDYLPPEAGIGPGADPVSELRELVEDAVSASLVSDVPIGLMLSGGIDSSAIAAIATRHVPPSELTAYSVAFGQPDDEANAASRLASDLGVRHREIRVAEEEVREHFDTWLTDLDYPSANPTWIASWFIARAAHADDIKVLISGDGADELFGGYNRWMKYLSFHDRAWARVPPPARRVGGRLAQRWMNGLGGDIARRAANGGDLFVPSRPFHDDTLVRTLGSSGLAAAAEAPPESSVERLRERFDERLPDGDYLTWMSYVTLRTKVVEDFLGRLDKMGMQHSVEGRVPLLDARLGRWAMVGPQALKVAGRSQKAWLRDALRPLLPEYVMNRPKQGFCPPVISWAEELLLGGRSLAEGPLFDSGVLRRDAASRLASTNGGASFAPWTLGVLAEWTNRYVS